MQKCCLIYTKIGMEDGLKEETLSEPALENIQNGVDEPVMANFPEGTVAITKDEKFNLFESSGVELNGSLNSSDDADDDSETDALVIDESLPKRRVKKCKRSSKVKSASENSVGLEENLVLHSNPYFNESLFELSQQHHNPQTDNEDLIEPPSKFNKFKRVKPKNGPKLREYAQYLGLQPAVQFKCSKCQRAGFESLPSLNEHLVNCTSDPENSAEVEDNSVSSFKLTRKVFLCSACGTYYENWNLYMHMLEFHRRFICLYCLGMFSVLDDLCQHIQNRHNWEPQQRETPDDFFKEYREPCYIICCECKKHFNEQDDFFYHKCVQCDSNVTSRNSSTKNLKNKCVKQLIRPENHVTGDSGIENQSEINSADPEVPMVRGETNSSDTPEMLPGALGSAEKNLESGTNLDFPVETFENNNIGSERFSIETMDKQESSDLTGDISVRDTLEENEETSPPVRSEENFEGEFSSQSAGEDDSKSNNEEEGVDDFEEMNGEESAEPFETRKVPKLSLKLSGLSSFSNVEPEDSEDSDKMDMEVDQIESEGEYCDVGLENVAEEPQIQIAGQEVTIVELVLEQPLDKFDIKVLLQKCLLASVPSCVYCNHARKIAVNGKQLGLHAIAEHRFSATVNSITAEELIPESFVNRIRESLDELDNVFFNLESNLSEEAVTFSHVFECFQCRYSTSVHKELYLHNRKMHTKNLLLCIMCKSNFYSYSELICHLCPGNYILDHDVQFRCCMCVSDDLPSAFRLMVHLRKRHHVCDVCLEMCHNQYKLSNHVWKHKLHHFCYRCGIAYRNKQDITRHLFWKHGTESVLCKKCLQKKWPHVFHFCIPPAIFTCDECSLNFTKPVYLKVHKRLHSNEKPHSCTFEDCGESFVSKKLAQKHEQQHLEPAEEEKIDVNEEIAPEQPTNDVENNEEKTEEKVKPKVDVYDLPELNLSESSDSESEVEPPKEEVEKSKEEDIIETLEERTLEVEQELANSVNIVANEDNHENTVTSAPILESIWDDFKIYQAKKEKIDTLFCEPEPEVVDETPASTFENALRDHDYFCDPETTQDTNVITEVAPDLSQRVDHDYCTSKEDAVAEAQPPAKTEKPDNSSSESDSSSCSCGSNCSCSSSSSSSSSSDSSDSDSSTEEGRKRQQARREKKKIKSEPKEPEKPVVIEKKPILETPILETDLETTESETDEEFYDKQPQKFAKKLLEEKRNQLLAEAGSLPNGSFMENSRNSTPSLPEEVKPKKKSKSKKRKKKKSERKEINVECASTNIIEPSYPFTNSPTVAPLTISLNKLTSSPSTPQTPYSKIQDSSMFRQEVDSSLRASKRRRVPNKFYGYSSDEEQEKRSGTPIKWRKIEPPTPPVPVQPPPMLVPPITIKTGPPTVEPITIRSTAKPGELRVHQRPKVPPLQINTSLLSRPTLPEEQSGSDSNDSAEEQHEPEPPTLPKETKNVQLYCYCRCPYDEVSEMIGCDSHDCAIEWFHFECVGIMVPPKGQWFCPDCRKRKQQRRELLQV